MVLQAGCRAIFGKEQSVWFCTVHCAVRYVLRTWLKNNLPEWNKMRNFAALLAVCGRSGWARRLIAEQTDNHYY